MKLDTIENCRAVIEKEVPYVDLKPYSHNIIGLVLSKINGTFGREEANKAIRDFGLEDLGWHQMDDDGQDNKN